MRRWWTRGLTAACLMTALTLAACARRKPAQQPAAEQPRDEAVRVRVGQATEVVEDETLAVTGSIFASTDVNLGAKIGGRVEFVGADDGERVGAGRLLVRLDSRGAEADLRRARGALDSARAALAKVTISQNLVEVQAATALRSAELELAAAKARLTQAGEALKLAETRSGGEGVDIAQAETSVESARSRLAQARDSLTITRTKVASDLTSATAAVEQARAGQQQAQAAVAQAETAVKLTDTSTQTSLENARQAQVAAQNQLTILQTGARAQERLQVQSQVSAAKSALQTAQIDYDRVAFLYERGAVAKAQFDNAKLMLDTRREQLVQAEQAASLVKEGPRGEEVRIAETQLAQAQQQLKLAAQSRESEVALRAQDLEKARKELERAKGAVQQAEAAKRAAEAALAQAPIQEQAVAQAEQALSQAEQAARLAHAGVGQAEIARQEVAAAKTAVSSAEERRRAAKANLIQPKLNREDIRALAGQVRQAEGGVTSAEVFYRDHSVHAPLSGKVAEKKVENGEVVAPGQVLFRLVADDTVHFEALVPEEKVRFVSVGSSVEVRVDAVPDARFTGHVMEILPAADLRSRTFTVKIGVPNDDGRLREGMFARGQIVVQKNRRSIRVPTEAVVTRDERNWLVRLDGDQATPIEVQIGATRGGLVEVTDGQVMAGDTIVVEGGEEIEKPQKVVVIRNGETPAAGAPPGS